MGKSDPLRKLTLVHLPAIVGAFAQTIREQDSTIERLSRDATRGAVRALENSMSKGRFEVAIVAALKGAFCEVPSVPVRVQKLRETCEQLEEEKLENNAVAEAVQKHRLLLTAEAAKLEADANDAEALGDPTAAATVRTIAAALREILAAPVKVETRKVWTAEYRVDRAAGNVKAGEFVAAVPPAKSAEPWTPKIGDRVKVTPPGAANYGKAGIIRGITPQRRLPISVEIDGASLAYAASELELLPAEGPTS